MYDEQGAQQNLLKTENIDEQLEELIKTTVKELLERETKGMNLNENQLRNYISEVPVYLKIAKKDSINLTLIDLPGIKYGNEQVTKRILDLSMKYIQNQEAIILYVITADIDFDNSQALDLIGKVDPERQRTLFVMSKIDKCELHISEKIEKIEKMFKLGVHCVRNRTQEELEGGVPFEQVRETEMALFKTHPELKMLRPQAKGTE